MLHVQLVYTGSAYCYLVILLPLQYLLPPVETEAHKDVINIEINVLCLPLTVLNLFCSSFQGEYKTT